MSDPNDRRRQLPSVDSVLRLPAVVDLVRSVPRNAVVAAAREAIARARERGDYDLDWAADIAERAHRRTAPSLFPVLNATGVVLHTNLGRAPLSTAAIEAMTTVARGYSNLELDVASGTRGSRLDHCASLLAEIAGAEAGFVVNNAAGALVLALNALAANREVIISRGELIEIGGSFRIPDILEKSGSTLREVGTTNRTHLADYQEAISHDTGAILIVHRSNFAMDGFVATPEPPTVAALAKERGIPIIYDVGSGLMVDLTDVGLSGEPLVPQVVAAADVVVFSGDKLLGGPQAGCVVGKKDWIDRLRRNPFARAMRTDKLSLAALEATLRCYRDPVRARREIPVLAMLTEPAERVAARAATLAAAIEPRWQPATTVGRSAVGGGSFPDASIPTTLVTIDSGPRGPDAVARALRLGDPSVLVRIEANRVVFDPRTLADEEVPVVVRQLGQVA